MKSDNFDILNEKKVYIDKELWYIPNFLTEEELAYLNKFSNEEYGWYITSRSSSIRNKFIGREYSLHPEGTICPTRGIDLSNTAMFPSPETPKERPEMFYGEGGVFDRMKAVLPETLIKDTTLQSFWPLKNEEIHVGAYDWHYELYDGADGESFNGMTAAWSIYLNDDFEGGILEFFSKPYKITPITGMLISIPMTKDFMHRVTPVTKGVRHTMYGVCFDDLFNRPISTGETC